LIERGSLFSFIGSQEKVCVKLHFGEEGNTGYVKPEYLKVVCDKVKEKGATPFLSDTNTLYRGRRTNSAEHLKLACEHGFTPDRTGSGIIIPDDTRRENCREVRINQKFIKSAKVAALYMGADSLIGVAHFKGHIMTGFGGALKNIGMGCATRKGKLEQHSNISPVIYQDKCIRCASCVEVCPPKAINIKSAKANIDDSKCIGCASCIAACNYFAIDVRWESGSNVIQEKMVEYAKAVLSSKKAKCCFVNFCLKITKECDCLAKDDPRIVQDIGILASLDPVALDKASMDMVIRKAGKDIFKELHPGRDGLKQLEYAASLGLGNIEYNLIAEA
jgi:uncharacterized Fe-S center protein